MSDNLSFQLSVRVSEDELKLIDAEAGKEHLSRASFLRSVILKEVARRKAEREAQPSQLPGEIEVLHRDPDTGEKRWMRALCRIDRKPGGGYFDPIYNVVGTTAGYSPDEVAEMMTRGTARPAQDHPETAAA